MTDSSPAAADEVATSVPRRTGGVAPAVFLSGIGPIVLALLVLCVILTLSTDSFLTADNLTNIVVQVSVVGICAIGGTFVIITSGIDLSVGSTVALAGMTAAWFMKEGPLLGGLTGLLVAVLVGVAIGAFNGASVTWLRLTPFIATLALLAMGRGLTQQISQGQTIFGFPLDFTFPGNGKIAGIQAPVVITVIAFIIGHLILTRTSFGHAVYAVGGNREAARLAGIPVRRVQFTVYVLAGLCAAIAGILLTGRLNAALPQAATGLELQVIAAIVIGGTSLFGGRGSLIGTFAGVLLIGVIGNGMTLLDVNPFWQQFIQGAVIFLAVTLDAINQRRLRSG